MASRPTFPLPQGFFSSGDSSKLTSDQQAHYKSVAQTQLDAILAAEHEFVHTRQRNVNSRKWRLAKKEHTLRTYRRRSGSLGPADQHALPSLLAVGQVDGTLEDLLYGMHTKSHEELQATMVYMDVSVRDSTVLHNIEVATSSDPFHYLGLKWTLTRLPAALLVKSRDWCYLEALGMARDRDGQRFGYAIAHSVDVASCPPFDERVAVRAQGSFAIIFREIVPGTVEIFAQGLYDPAGDLIPHVSVTMTIEIFSRLAKTSQCAEAKKLTAMAVRHFTATQGYEQHSHQTQTRCYLCVKGSGMFASLKMCNVCGATACAKCRVKRLVFTGVSNALCEIACCKTCILDAKSMTINPAGESFVLHSSDQHSNLRETVWQGAHQLSYGSSSTDGEQLFSSHEHDHNDTSDEDINSLSGASEKDFERIIEDMIERKVLSKSQRLVQMTKEPESPLPHSHFHHRRVPSWSPSDSLPPPRPHHRRVVSWSPSDGSPPISPEYSADRIPPPMTEEQADLFSRMFALQNAAHYVYAITQANREMMNKM
ncbi:hypothetical protein Gpo141_00003342 [Globisporangium polare]